MGARFVTIFAALRDNKENKIESWDLSDQNFNPEIAKVLAEYVSVSMATPRNSLMSQRKPLNTLKRSN